MTKFDSYYYYVLENNNVELEEGIGSKLKALGLGAALALTPLSVGAASDSPRGIRNNNPGNIVKSSAKWEGLSGDDGKFVKFSSPEYGIRALGRNLRTYYLRDKLTTIEKILSKYTDDPIANYISYLEKATGKGKDDDLELFNTDGTVKNPTILKEVLKGIIRFENSNYAYPEDTVDKGIAMISGQAPKATTTATQKYKIVKGDNLSKIAKQFKVSVKDILALNTLKDPNKLSVGTEILLPSK